MTATPAAAQQSTQADSTAPKFVAADTGTSQPPRRADTPIEVRGQFGGVFWGGGSGFILGAGIGARPFNNHKVEVTGDFSFLRFEGENGVYVAGNGLYHFSTNEPNFSPYAGGGIGVINGGGDTEARLQILGGLELKSASKHPIRPEVRFIFTEHDTTTILMVSIGLGKR
jgi:hypothetical protein